MIEEVMIEIEMIIVRQVEMIVDQKKMQVKMEIDVDHDHGNTKTKKI
jgi:hypothetical protein